MEVSSSILAMDSEGGSGQDDMDCGLRSQASSPLFPTTLPVTVGATWAAARARSWYDVGGGRTDVNTSHYMRLGRGGGRFLGAVSGYMRGSSARWLGKDMYDDKRWRASLPLYLLDT